MTEYPVYLERGDRLYYDIYLQSSAPVKVYNVDAGRMLKIYNKTSIKDSLLEINSAAIFLFLQFVRRFLKKRSKFVENP